MTILQERQVEPERPPDEALFKEARQRRRRRWAAAIGIVALVLIIVVSMSLVVRGHIGRTGPTQHLHSSPNAGTPAPPSQSILTAGALKEPGALAMAPDGGVLIDERGSNQIVEREPSGRFVVVAGNGHVGSGGDGGPAASASLDQPAAVAVSSRGTIYVADQGNNRIRSIDGSGTITTMAKVEQPTALGLGPDDTLFVVDVAGVQTIGADGALKTVVPSAAGPTEDPIIDGSRFAVDPDAVAVSSSGDVYVANFSPKIVIRFSTTGPPSLVGQTSSGIGGTYVAGAGLASGADGTVVVADYGDFSIDRISGSGISPVVRFGRGSIPGVHGVFRPAGVAVAPDGEIYASTSVGNGSVDTSALVAIDPDGTVHLLDKGAPARSRR